MSFQSMRSIHFLRWFILLLPVKMMVAQTNYTLDAHTQSTHTIKWKKSFKDSTALINYIRDIRWNAVKKGYLLASCDTLRWQKGSCHVYFYEGPRFDKIQLTPEIRGKKDKRVDRLIDLKLLKNATFQPRQLESLLRETENSFLNAGFPFCSLTLKDVHYPNEGIAQGTLVINPGNEYHINEIKLKGDSSISEIFISSLLNIKKGDLFDESKLKAIPEKIAQIPFLKEIKPHELLFTESGCEVFLYLKSNPVSSANGTVGLQPNPTTNRVGLAGELNLKLLNILKRGEQLNLNWRSIRDQTQSMQLKLNYPFLFKSPFGIDAQLHLYKKDSTFIEVKSMLGIQYSLRSGAYLKAFYQQYSNNLLSAGSSSASMQSLSNLNSSSYGLSLFKRSLDYIPNPSKGYIFLLESAVGTRKSKLDTIQIERTTTCRFLFLTEWFLPVSKRHVVRFASVNEFYYAPTIYQNELFRFGGQLSLRGFNEDELFASARNVTTIEYRYLLDRNSNLFLFYDQGYFENRALTYRKDHPYGFGAGLSFGTNLGIFSLSYALGSQQGNPILLKNGKIHFGYIAYF